MEQYIDKSDIVAEIEKRIKETEEHWKSPYGIETATGQGILMGYRDILSFLNTLEVKEVHDIWHDVSEKPELEQPLLIIMNGTHKDFRRHYRIGCYGKRANDIPTWVINGCYSDSFIFKWCYISDILQYAPEVKEVDLEEEIKRFTMSKELYDADSVIKAVAKHFFELG